MTATTIFVLQHEYQWCHHDDVKLIGVYATAADAQAAIERLRTQPGFRDYPEGFCIDCYPVGVDHWTEGFVKIINILIPTQNDSYQIAGAVWQPGDLYEIIDIPEPEHVDVAVGDWVRCQEMAVPGYGEHAQVAVRASQTMDK